MPSVFTDTGKTYVSTFKLPDDETTYTLKDTQARTAIDNLNQAITGGIHYIGITTTTLTDGSTTQSVSIDSNSVQATEGDVVIYGEKEFIWNGSKWQLFGDNSDIATELAGLGDMAHADTASGSFTPAGTISTTTTIDATHPKNYEPSGTVSAASSSSTTAANYYQPTGTITNTTSNVTSSTPGYYKPAGSVSMSSTNGVTYDGTIEGSITVGGNDGTSYTPAGGVTITTTNVSNTDDGYFLPSGVITPTDTTSNAVTATSMKVATTDGTTPQWQAQVTNGELSFSWSAGSMPTFVNKEMVFAGNAVDLGFEGTATKIGFQGANVDFTFTGTDSAFGFSGDGVALSFTGADTHIGFAGTAGSVAVTPDEAQSNP